MLCRTPIARARRAILAGPTCCISCAVIVFLEYAKPSRKFISLPEGGLPSVGRQISPPPTGISTAWSTKVASGLMPWRKASP